MENVSTSDSNDLEETKIIFVSEDDVYDKISILCEQATEIILKYKIFYKNINSKIFEMYHPGLTIIYTNPENFIPMTKKDELKNLYTNSLMYNKILKSIFKYDNNNQLDKIIKELGRNNKKLKEISSAIFDNIYDTDFKNILENIEDKEIIFKEFEPKFRIL